MHIKNHILYIYTPDIVWKRALTDCGPWNFGGLGSFLFFLASVNLHYGWSWWGLKMEKLWKVWGGISLILRGSRKGSWSKIWVRWLSCCSLCLSKPKIWSKTLSGWPPWTRSDKVYFVSPTFTSYFWKGCHVEKSPAKDANANALCLCVSLLLELPSRWDNDQRHNDTRMQYEAIGVKDRV